MNKRRVNLTTKRLTRSAVISALYVALTSISGLFGLASGVIQFRLSEALCVLPLVMPEAVLGLTVGCLISNLIAGGVIWDILFGSLATLIGAVGTYMLKRLPKRLIFLATLPPVIANAVIVPFVLIYAYGAPDALYFLMLTVGFGELVCCTMLGTLLYYSTNKNLLRKL